MRAVVIHEFGDPSGMAVVEVPTPATGPGQVLIATEAIGVGGVDAVIRRGTIRRTDFGPGLIPGSEVAGTVVAVGDGVDPSWKDRQVWAFTGMSGGYAEMAVAAVEDITALPSGLSSIEAATLGSAATVAHFALRHAHFSAGESVLVRGAGGSIGIAAVQIAARAGAGAVAVTTSSQSRGDRLRELGATNVLNRTGGPAEAAYDVIIDIAGGPDVPDFIDRLAANGRLVLVGAVAGMPTMDVGARLLQSFQQSRSLATFSLDSIPAAQRGQARSEQFEASARGDLRAVIHDVLPLDQAAEAHRRMDAGEVFGRIVLAGEHQPADQPDSRGSTTAGSWPGTRSEYGRSAHGRQR
ncbi:zinc-binding dehydrogenase [Kineosporia rhizophila]|uniref:zinc-binding dehydrogenase n=1 Tax=Kineosporia TaxID=49184 RepID=UPI000B1FFD4A|nr:MULTISPECIES: zinc-binding dehydrogenase [Kineosporia]MCE0535387.1 zinc-binding dehydrogenase [Kineosporia rhizophila]GLY16832.1 oxidoreductase [Kineosporia sp. NBRC 101677]